MTIFDEEAITETGADILAEWKRMESLSDKLFEGAAVLHVIGVERSGVSLKATTRTRVSRTDEISYTRGLYARRAAACISEEKQ